MSKHSSQHHGHKDEAAPENTGAQAEKTADQAAQGAGDTPDSQTAGHNQTEMGVNGSGEAAQGAQDAANSGAEARETAAQGPESPKNGEKAAGAAGTGAVPLTSEEKIAELETQLADTKDQLLRKAADFENFRKRMNQEKQNAIDFANQTLLLDLIPVIDDFERAIQAAGNSQKAAADFDSLFEGISMIEKRLISQLESKWGLKRFDSAGEAFDPNRHEALMMEKSADISDPVVKEDLIKGYTLKDRVVRAAKVKVLMPETGGQGA
jgi:molecular chaperone GrpE